MGVQWLCDGVLDSKLRGCGFKPHQHHCVVPLARHINSYLALVQPMKNAFQQNWMMLNWDVKYMHVHLSSGVRGY